jgi:hypothetical protein
MSLPSVVSREAAPPLKDAAGDPGKQQPSLGAFLQLLDQRSRTVLVVLTLLFLVLEAYYVFHRPLSHDEFNGVWCVVQVTTGVPYVDFEPYKPVLGYYLQLALLQLAPDTWSGYILIRAGMTLLTVATLFLGALLLRHLFRPAAVCLAYALLVVMTSLVEWAIEVRLDMLTALFGFVSLLFLLERRVVVAGVFAGLSFLISQKGTMYALAGGAGLLACVLFQREPRRWRDLLVYSASVAGPIALYVAFWSLFAPCSRVCAMTFGQATQLHALTTPIHGGAPLYTFYWQETLFRNPLFYLYTLWALVILLTRWREQTPRETLLLFYGVTVAVVILNIRQPWRYMFVLLPPTAFVLHAYLFAHQLAIPDSLLRKPIMWTCYVMLGLVWPLTRVPVVVQDDSGPQRQTLQIVQALLQPGDKYFAGFQVLYRGDFHESALGMVDTNTAFPIHGLTPAEHTGILERFQAEPVRLLVYTSVIDDGVPERIKKHLWRSYAPFWGNVWIYAPQCQPAGSEVNLLFAGSYTIETEQPGRVVIDGQPHASGETIELERGPHAVTTPVRLRLKLKPAGVEHLLNPAYREPVWFFWPDSWPVPTRTREGQWVED